ncbi:MAG TPA: glycosyltransferase, partial [Bryobacteraceae bacterium]
GRVPDGELRDLYASCRALILPGEEDFGMTAVEALASGKPVVALGRGGVLESVPLREPCGGVFYDSPDENQLEAALSHLEKLELRIVPQDLQRYARRFSLDEFLHKMARTLGVPESSPKNFSASGNRFGNPKLRNNRWPPISGISHSSCYSRRRPHRASGATATARPEPAQ